jgi:hypothetical protein
MHVQMVEDAGGDLVDILYACSAQCAEVGKFDHPSAWPGGTETDYDQHCDTCGDHIAHGLQCPTDCTTPEEVAS